MHVVEAALARPDQPRILRWEDPPPSERHPFGRNYRDSMFTPIAAELLDHPGRWAVLYEGDKNRAGDLANRVRYGTVRCFAPAGDFEGIFRRVGDRYAVYARYVGDGEAS